MVYFFQASVRFSTEKAYLCPILANLSRNYAVFCVLFTCLHIQGKYWFPPVYTYSIVGGAILFQPHTQKLTFRNQSKNRLVCTSRLHWGHICTEIGKWNGGWVKLLYRVTSITYETLSPFFIILLSSFLCLCLSDHEDADHWEGGPARTVDRETLLGKVQVPAFVAGNLFSTAKYKDSLPQSVSVPDSLQIQMN